MCCSSIWFCSRLVVSLVKYSLEVGVGGDGIKIRPGMNLFDPEVQEIYPL